MNTIDDFVEYDLRNRLSEIGRKLILHEKTIAKLSNDFLREMRDHIYWNDDKMLFILKTRGKKFYKELFKNTKEEKEWFIEGVESD